MNIELATLAVRSLTSQYVPQEDMREFIKLQFSDSLSLLTADDKATLIIFLIKRGIKPKVFVDCNFSYNVNQLLLQLEGLDLECQLLFASILLDELLNS